MLIDELRRARESKGLTRNALASLVAGDAQTVKRLEVGVGSVANLVRVMSVLEFNIANLGRGKTIVDQVRNARLRKGWSIEMLAGKAGVARGTVTALERGDGSVRSMLRVMNVLGTKARRAMPIRPSWQHDRTGDRDVRFTPPWFLDRIEEAFGLIDLDPCAHPNSPVAAVRKIILPDCGLAARWTGEFAFVNPPFSSLSAWIVRAADAFDAGEVERVVMLAPVRPDTAVFKARMVGRCDIGLLTNRMRFLNADGSIGHPAPFALMVAIWGAPADQVARFRDLVPAIWLPRG